jgi:hypothetical protein
MKLLLMLVAQLTHPVSPPKSKHCRRHFVLTYPKRGMLIFFHKNESQNSQPQKTTGNIEAPKLLSFSSKVSIMKKE